MATKLPSIVIVGRPNVGKSTLFNRLTGTRRSIVTNEPGITRDRIYGTANWEGRAFEVVDTGGIVPEDKAGIPGEILRQARVAIENATRVVQVVDGREGRCRSMRSWRNCCGAPGKPPVIAVNKVDSPKQAELAAQFYELGDEVFPISAEHGFGVDTLLDALTQEFRDGRSRRSAKPDINIAIIGRPNVGKSTLLNQLVGRGALHRFARAGHHARRGGYGGRAPRQDVPLPRHRGNPPQGQDEADRRKVERDHGAAASGARGRRGAGGGRVGGRHVARRDDRELRRAVGPVGDHRDEQVGPGARSRAGKSRARESARRQRAARARIPASCWRSTSRWSAQKFKFLAYAPIVFLSALTGERIEKLYTLIDRVAEARRRRISTGELNRWLANVDLDRGTSPASRKVKIYYITQATAAPPTFVLFTNQTKPLHFSYQRFLENRLREAFDFVGHADPLHAAPEETRSPRPRGA